MDLHTAVVRHRGDLTMTIHKRDLTAAEIVLLRQIHGDDAVVQIQKTRETRRSGREELLRLADRYGPTAVREAWPGASPVLPKTLADAGLHESGVPLDDVPPSLDEVTEGIDPAVIDQLKEAGLDPAALD